MEQLIFVGIILLFSILEAVARKKKEGAEGGGDVPAPPPPRVPEPRRPARAPAPGPVAYDQDPTFDEEVTSAEGSRRREATASSEGLIPGDVWEEIAALARGGVPPSAKPGPATVPKPAPRPAPSSRPAPAPYQGRTGQEAHLPRPPQRKAPVPAAPLPSRPAPRAPVGISGRKAPATPPPLPAAAEEIRPAHALHETHVGLGQPVGTRLTSFAGDGRARGLSPDVAAARKLLSGGPATLRQAVILTEVLGPPASMKDE